MTTPFSFRRYYKSDKITCFTLFNVKCSRFTHYHRSEKQQRLRESDFSFAGYENFNKSYYKYEL